MNKEKFITELDKLFPKHYGLQFKIVAMADEYAQSQALHIANVMRGGTPEPLPFEQFADVYQFAFGGCDEQWLKQRYADWLKGNGA